MNDQPRTLGGRYQLGKVIGRGGMAQVRQATDTRLGREVAIKELRQDLASDSTFQARFRREAQAAAGLNHPNIVSVYDTGEELDPATGIHVPYIVMELVHGRTLRDILREGRPILPQRALEFTQGVLAALNYSHKAGIIHRDIKPANVMLTTSGLVKVMDFGIARAVSDTSSTMTQTAAVIGTAQYLSPEQARGETVDSRSDIYSAGCLMYELLVGRPPFQGDSPVSVAYQHVRELPVAPSTLDSEITPAMDAVVLKALAKDPDERYDTAAAMRDDISRILAGQQVSATLPIAAPPVPVGHTSPVASPAAETVAFDTVAPRTQTQTAQRAIEPEPRRGRGWLWGLLAFVLVAAIGLAASQLWRPEPPAPKEVSMISVYGQSREVAEKMLIEEGFQPVVEPVKGANDDTVNTVIKQSPPGNTKVRPGAVVTITINMGPDKVSIPVGLIVNKHVDEAKQALSDLGLHNVRTQDATSEPADAKAGTVLDVTPAEGTPVTADSPIVLKVATGRAVVPDVRGLPEAEAKQALNRQGFYDIAVKPQASPGTAPGSAINTSPVVNTLADKNGTITLYVAITPTQTPTATPSTTPEPSASPKPSTPKATPSG